MSYYNIKGGLHSAEIRLLQRSLREHLQTATKHKADVRAAQKAGDPNIKAFELTQAQDAIDALVRLSNRLRRELEPHTPPTFNDLCAQLLDTMKAREANATISDWAEMRHALDRLHHFASYD